MIPNVTIGLDVKTGFTKMNYALGRTGHKLSPRKSNLTETETASCFPCSRCNVG